MNNYMYAYAVGYFHGRAYPNDADEQMKEQDSYYRDTPAFKKGLEDGQRDFEGLDLPPAALAQKEVE